MPFKDRERAREAANERNRRYRARKRLESPPCPRGRHGHHARGERNGRWNGGRTVTSHGYVRIRMGKGYPMADSNGYVYEHHLVMMQMLGRPLEPGETVHHKNHNRADNRQENLELLNRSDHARMHVTQDRRRDPTTGKLLPDAQLGTVWARENSAHDRHGGDIEEWRERHLLPKLDVREFPQTAQAEAVAR